MDSHEMKHLVDSIGQLRRSLGDLANDQDLEELLKIIHRPGWTTPAEFQLVAGIVDSIQAHARALVGLKQALLAGSQKVGAQAARS